MNNVDIVTVSKLLDHGQISTTMNIYLHELDNDVVTKCTLWPYLADIDRQANEMYELLIEQMKETEGVTEELKEGNQLEWVQRMGNIQQRASEIVYSELIYT